MNEWDDELARRYRELGRVAESGAAAPDLSDLARRDRRHERRRIAVTAAGVACVVGAGFWGVTALLPAGDPGSTSIRVAGATTPDGVTGATRTPHPRHTTPSTSPTAPTGPTVPTGPTEPMASTAPTGRSATAGLSASPSGTGSTASTGPSPAAGPTLSTGPTPTSLIGSPVSSRVVQVWLSSATGTAAGCHRLIAVTRVVPTNAAVAATLQRLVAGPTVAEQAAGLSSPFAALPATSVNVVRQGDAVTVDFRAPVTLDAVPAACRRAEVRAALEQTLEQFPGVTTRSYLLGGSAPAFTAYLNGK